MSTSKARSRLSRRSEPGGNAERVRGRGKGAQDERERAFDGSGGMFEDRRGGDEPKKAKPRRVRRRIDASKLPFTTTGFEVRGLNHARLITLLSERAVIRGVKSEEGLLRFRASSRRKGEIVALLDTLCYDYQITAERGPLLALVRLAGRAGVVAGTLALTAALILFPHSVTSVEFTGEWSAEAARILSQNGVEEGKLLFSFDGDALAARIMELDGVSFASVRKVGTRVYADIRTETRGGSLAGVPGKSVRAARQASVTRVIVFSGTAAVKYGDVVREGDELISGYVTAGEEKVPSPAAGEVYGKVWRREARFFPETRVEAVPGEVKEYARISFGSGVPKAPEPPFDDYTLEISVARNGLLLPYTVYTFRYTEVTYREVSSELAPEQAERIALSDAVTELPAGAVLIGAEAESERAEGGVLVKVTLCTEERIDDAG